MGLWNCSDSVALSIFIWDFGTVATVWYYLFYMGIWNCSDIVALFVFIWDFGTVVTMWHYGFCFGVWNCSNIVALLVFLLDFGTVPTVCGIVVFFYWTLELFRQLCHYWFFIVFIHNLL